MGRRSLAGYRSRIRALLVDEGVGADAVAVERFVAAAREQAGARGETLEQALERRLRARRRERPRDAASATPPCFVCDASLGGLARWLRAAGYEARWSATVTADELIRDAVRHPALILTTNSALMERGVVRDGRVPALWLSSGSSRLEQLCGVLVELGLPLQAARCMGCGGVLRPVAKREVRERIPPRTALWKDEYLLCTACGQLYWEGTHWDRIRARLQALAGGAG
jgi:uncharacterized protein with PIN domain